MLSVRTADSKKHFVGHTHALQGLVLAAFPMVNYWRSDIETLLSERLDAKVTISEIGARASWTGPYLEALNIVIEKEQGSIEIRRVQMLTSSCIS